MGTKENPGPFDCYADALPDEPIFVLLARDRVAPGAIRAWARLRRSQIDMRILPESDETRIKEALDCAKNMEDWRKANNGKWREPRPIDLSPLHASVPDGFKCSDCSIDKEACVDCYKVWWTRRHPNWASV